MTAVRAIPTLDYKQSALFNRNERTVSNYLIGHRVLIFIGEQSVFEGIFTAVYLHSLDLLASCDKREVFIAASEYDSAVVLYVAYSVIPVRDSRSHALGVQILKDSKV